MQKINGKSFAVLPFEQLPSESGKQELAASGIQLLEYIPEMHIQFAFQKISTTQFCRKQGQDQFLLWPNKRCIRQWQKEYFHHGR